MPTPSRVRVRVVPGSESESNHTTLEENRASSPSPTRSESKFGAKFGPNAVRIGPNFGLSVCQPARGAWSESESGPARPQVRVRLLLVRTGERTLRVRGIRSES